MYHTLKVYNAFHGVGYSTEYGGTMNSNPLDLPPQET